MLTLGGSTLPPGNVMERARFFTRKIEFDYISWTVNAFLGKISQYALGTSNYIRTDQQTKIVYDYIALLGDIQKNQADLNDIYTNPHIQDPQAASLEVRQELDRLLQHQKTLQPLAEAVLQNQISQVLGELNLVTGGQTIPPVMYHTTTPPSALIVSPRNAIRQDLDISLSPDLSVVQHANLESQVDKALNVSSLVVGIGGVGLYPTMVQQTTNLAWLIETVAHEWTHNYLFLRPLGISYLNSPELRTMNETTASIAGKEIGRAVFERFYPELLPPPTPAPQPGSQANQPAPEPPTFDFRAEMHTTRVEVDRLLSLGKITEAESYMEARRQFFWENGYHIRKINQAYFAFYGAYAEEPGGAAGEDPVGAAVRLLRSQNSSLSAFINQIGKMWSYEQLKVAVHATP
jgi:hypothetical protein